MSFRRDLVWEQLEHVYRSSVAHQVARYACGLTWDQLPGDVVHQAKRCVLDALGCAIGSANAPGRAIIEAVALELGGPQEATIIGSGARTSAMHAALVNSFLVRFLDLNDTGGGGHNSDALASLLAVAERERRSGADLLLALVVSYELGGRFADAVTNHPVGTPVTSSLEEKGWTKDIRAGLNQPASIGLLLGMTEEQIAHAIGICLSHALPLGILDAHREEATMAKNIRFGWVAHDAILACLLARQGFTGPRRVVESEVGIRSVISRGELDVDRLTDFSGWRILKTRFKTLALNGTTHAHVMATMRIVTAHDLRPEDVASVRIRAPIREARHTTAPPKKYPRNAESADHSAYYANAIAIRDRAVLADSVDPALFNDQQVLDLIERITVEPDPSLTYYQGASEIETRDGRRFSEQVDTPRGFGDDPLTDDEIETKVRELAAAHMPVEQVEELISACWRLDELEDLSELTRPLVFDAG
jgi:2-methylcitrate dehydratase